MPKISLFQSRRILYNDSTILASWLNPLNPHILVAFNLNAAKLQTAQQIKLFF